MRPTAAFPAALAALLLLVTLLALTGDEVVLSDYLKNQGFRVLRVRRNATDWFRVTREGHTLPHPVPVLRGRAVRYDVDWERRDGHADFGYAEDAREFAMQVAAKEHRTP